MKFKQVLILILVILGILSVNCGDLIFDDDDKATSSISISIQHAPSNVAGAKAFVYASDMDTVISMLTVSNNTVSGIIRGISTGNNRSLKVETYNSDNVANYRGVKNNITIEEGVTVSVYIVLYKLTGNISINGTFSDSSVILYDPLIGTDPNTTTFISGYGGTTNCDIAYETITINSRDVLAIKIDRSANNRKYIKYDLPSVDVKTIEFWWKSPSVTTDNEIDDYLFIILNEDKSVASPQFWSTSSVDANPNKLRMNITGVGSMTTDISPAASTIYFFSIVNDVSAGTVGLYINAQYVGTLTGNFNIQDDFNVFLNGYDGATLYRSTGGNYFDLALFNYTKTPTEISADYQNTLGSDSSHLFMYERY